MKRWILVALIGSVVLSSTFVAAAPAGAEALDLTTFGAIVYDEAHHHVFVSGGPGTTKVYVLDDAANVVATLTSTAGTGPDGMAISADGATLFVALADSAAIARFSTSSLSEGTSIPMPEAVDQPRSLAFAGGLLWTGFCGNGGGIASISLADDSVVTYQGEEFPGCRVRGGGPGADDRLFAWYPWGEPGGVNEFTISGGVPSLTASATLAGQGRLPDVAVSNDGSTMYAAHVGPGSVGAYDVDDLTPTGDPYVTGDHTAAVAVDANDRIFAGTFGGGLHMYTPGTPDAAWAQGMDNGGIWDQGIAMNSAGSRVFVVVGQLFSYVTVRVAYPDQTATAISLAVAPATIRYGSAATLEVHASLNGPDPERHVIVQGRRIGGTWKKVTSGKVDVDGDLAVKVRPTVNTDYRVVYAGDEYNARATSEEARVDVAVVVRGRLVGSSGSSGAYHLYRTGETVRYVGLVDPRRRGRLQFRLVKRKAGAWKTVAVASFSMGKDGSVGVFINPRALHRGDRFRIRAEFQGDRKNAGNVARWSYFRIT